MEEYKKTCVHEINRKREKVNYRLKIKHLKQLKLLTLMFFYNKNKYTYGFSYGKISKIDN